MSKFRKKPVVVEAFQVPERGKFNPDEWTEVRRGFGSIKLSKLKADECVTASGLRDGGYIVWQKRDNSGNFQLTSQRGSEQ